MLSDNKIAIREQAYMKIKSYREEQSENKDIRKFLVPSLKLDAEDYTDMID